jgi:hyperosmotically inducible periplasmic protein
MKIIILLGSLCLIGIAGCNEAKTSSPPATAGKAEASSVEPTNTAVNVRDRAGNAKTPIDQNENQADINLTATIRKRVVGTEMSTDAHNVKIISQDGRVTLRGPVKSPEEKAQIEAIAQDVAGKDKVESQLEVAP